MSATDFVRKSALTSAPCAVRRRPAQESRHDSMRVFHDCGSERLEERAMLVVMRQGATPAEIAGVVRAIEAREWKAHPIPGAQRTAIGITGNRGAVDRPVFESMPGVLEVIPVTHAYKLVSREVKPENSVVKRGRRGRGRRRLRDHRRAVRRRVARPDADRGARGEGRRGHACCAAAPSSRGRARTRSRGSARRGSRSWRARARRPACPSSPRRSTPRASTSSSATPTRSRSARATCRTSRC